MQGCFGASPPQIPHFGISDHLLSDGTVSDGTVDDPNHNLRPQPFL